MATQVSSSLDVIPLGAPGPLGVEGVGHAYRTANSLPYSVEKQFILSFTDVCTSDDLVSGLVDKAGSMLNPLLAALGLKPMIVTRDFRIQLHPSMVDGTGMIPGVGDRVWGRMYIADLNKAYIRCEWELRLVGTWDNDAYVETDIAGPPSTWGQGRSRRPGRPLAAGWVGYMMVVRDKATHRLRIAPPADVPKDEWIRRGVFNPSILATEPDQWSWLLSSPEADGFVADEVVAKDNWKALPDFVWRARRCDNDSLGHTTVHRRMLPFFEACYVNLPTYRIAGIFFECKTEIMALTDCHITGIHDGGARARFLLENGGGPGKLNRAGVWLVDKSKLRLKAAGGGAA